VEELTRDIDPLSLRIDQRLTHDDQLFLRFGTFDANDLQPFGTGALQETLVPGFGRTLTTSTRNLSFNHTHVFGRSVMNEVRFGWMRVEGEQASLNRGMDFADETGLLGVTRDPREKQHEPRRHLPARP
jgi:hypothetical protein